VPITIFEVFMVMDKIKICTPADQRGKVSHAEIEFSAGGSTTPVRLPLTDTLLQTSLPSENLSQVCKESGGKSGYYLTDKTLKILKSKLQAAQKENETVLAGINPDIVKNLQWLSQNPPPLLETPTPSQNEYLSKYLTTGIKLSHFEVALIRHAMGDLQDPESSMLRRVPNPYYGDQKDQPEMRYAFSLKMESEQYEKIIYFLSQLAEGMKSEPFKMRLTMLQQEIKELKNQFLVKPVPEKPIIPPDSYLGDQAAEKRVRIARLSQELPPPVSNKINLDHYILMRVPLFPEEVAFLRIKMGDEKANQLFVSYQSVDPKKNSQEPQTYFIHRKIKWDELIAHLATLQNRCKSERMSEDMCNRVGKLVKEAERLDSKVKDEDLWHQFKKHGLVIGAGFAVAGVGVGIGLKGTGWFASKIANLFRGPPGPGGPTGPASPSSPTGQTSPTNPSNHLARRSIRWGQGLKTLGWGLATIGAGALTFFLGTATAASGAATGVAVVATPGIPDEIIFGGLTVVTAAGTAKSAALTATAASGFILCGRNFIGSFFD
jgi:hypothetical protein